MLLPQIGGGLLGNKRCNALGKSVSKQINVRQICYAKFWQLLGTGMKK